MYNFLVKFWEKLLFNSRDKHVHFSSIFDNKFNEVSKLYIYRKSANNLYKKISSHLDFFFGQCSHLDLAPNI